MPLDSTGARTPWTTHAGGACPVPGTTAVVVVYRRMDGDTSATGHGWAQDFPWRWASKPTDADIVAYMVGSSAEQTMRDGLAASSSNKPQEG